MNSSIVRDDEREGVWVTCEMQVGPDSFRIQAFVADDDDITQHAEAVLRQRERLEGVGETVRDSLTPRL